MAMGEQWVEQRQNRQLSPFSPLPPSIISHWLIHHTWETQQEVIGGGGGSRRRGNGHYHPLPLLQAPPSIILCWLSHHVGDASGGDGKQQWWQKWWRMYGLAIEQNAHSTSATATTPCLLTMLAMGERAGCDLLKRMD